MNSLRILTICILVCAFAVSNVACVGEAEVKDGETEETKDDGKTEEVTEEQLEYAKGSLCGYCDYCKFCKLCDEDCPCETSQSKPNCKMCKYCKYCYLCSAVCKTICKPGGIVDRVTAGLVNSLPSVNRDHVDSDIESVQHWIDKKKDEL